MNSSRQRSEQENGGRNASSEALRVWAKALGCRPDQVLHVVQLAGLSEEKLWRSLTRT